MRRLLRYALIVATISLPLSAIDIVDLTPDETAKINELDKKIVDANKLASELGKQRDAAVLALKKVHGIVDSQTTSKYVNNNFTYVSEYLLDDTNKHFFKQSLALHYNASEMIHTGCEGLTGGPWYFGQSGSHLYITPQGGYFVN